MVREAVIAEKDQEQTQRENVESQFDLTALIDELGDEHADGDEKQEARTEDLEFASTEHLHQQGLPKPCPKVIERRLGNFDVRVVGRVTTEPKGVSVDALSGSLLNFGSGKSWSLSLVDGRLA